MNSVQIEEIGRKWLGSNWLGVFPLDKIPFISENRALIVNTQSSNLGGEHWIAVYNKPEHVLAFDPFGFYYPPLLVSHLSSLSKPIVYNKIRYQEWLSTTCGQHCLLWLKFQAGLVKKQHCIE